MKQIFKRIFQILLGISLLLLIAGAVITLFFSEEIEEKVVSKIQQQMTSELQLGDIDFSFYEKFPSASVKITDLLAFEKGGFDDDTLFYAKTTYIELPIFDIILNTIDIKKVVVSDGELNIKYDTENNPNFAIFKTSGENKNQILLNQILVLNTSVKCKKNSIDIDWHTSKTLLVFKENNLSINAKLFSAQLEVNNQDYIHEKNIQVHTTLSFKKDSVFIQPGTIIHIEETEVELSGGIFYGNSLDLNFSCNTQELAGVIKHTPEHLKTIYDSFRANGKLSCTGSINGLISNKSSPLLNMNYHVESGDFTLKNRPFILKNISLDGKITNGKNRNFITTKIEISRFDAETENGSIKGDFTIKNLNKYYLIANLSSSWDLAEINHYFEDSPFFNLQGRLFANTQYSGYFSFDSKFKNYFITSQHSSNATFKNTTFKYKNLPLDFNFQTVDCKVKNNIIEVENSAVTIADSDLKFNGIITDLIPYIWNRKEKINVTGDLNSTYIKFEELFTIKDINEGEKEDKSGTGFPNWIKASLNSTIATFAYNDFIATEASGLLDYKNLTLTGENIQLSTLNGSVAGNFKFDEHANNQLKLSSRFNLKQINIRNAFLAFDNFKQDFMTAEHIKGIGTAEIEMKATWDTGFILKAEELEVKSHLIIEKGELIQFKPLEKLSDYVRLEDLKEVKFSTLENTIEIENNVINIPTMEIKSSALSISISGTHTFEQEIKYDIELALSELMSTKFRKKNAQISKTEFGEVEEDGKIFNTIYFKMAGNSDDPKISLDPTRFLEDVQELVKKEGEKITTIIKEDLLQIKEPEEIEQGQDVIIEWNDDKNKRK